MLVVIPVMEFDRGGYSKPRSMFKTRGQPLLCARVGWRLAV
jgi:hypothetical protein